MQTSKLSRLLGGGALVTACLLGTACGPSTPKTTGVASLGGGSTTTVGKKASTSSADRDKAFLDFAKCMRDHGVDIQDPTSDGPGLVRIGGPGSGPESAPDKGKLDAADAACRGLLKDAAPQDIDPADRQRFQDQALAFARCMREHGLDFPDPQIEGDGKITQSLQGDPSAPAFQAAQKECQDKVGGPGAPGGGGPGVVVSSGGGSVGGFSTGGGKP